MKSHLYRITVEHLEDPKGNAVSADPLIFEARNHDDLFSIVDKMREKSEFDKNETEALAIGLKLFSEVMLNNRDHELFKELNPHFVQFIKALKKR